MSSAGVVAAPGFADAYRQFVEGGWMSLAFPEAFGGQGLPKAIGTACGHVVGAAIILTVLVCGRAGLRWRLSLMKFDGGLIRRLLRIAHQIDAV